MSAKRLRTPKLKPGELRVYWGHEPHDTTREVMFAYSGDRLMKRDTNLLHAFMASPRVNPLARPLWSSMEKGLLQQLQERGYDLSTLKFSICKKNVPEGEPEREVRPADLDELNFSVAELELVRTAATELATTGVTSVPDLILHRAYLAGFLRCKGYTAGDLGELDKAINKAQEAREY